ncbi:2-oxoglutarate dehydrogenase, mitochondrial [Dichanthelium oligosanthes]|uniref:2-oxoglutarate dehydrogenase, mitochondrial n=1 Tax=Dichanthelium oligosanthes TaxID=888268 RepID=A0A1E5WFT8_9POAL|nr:2-oxoglutarate dehydrogenase, mitochondrial [Dichanthelium oligosanthes]
MQLLLLVRDVQANGHMIAQLDPLGLDVLDDLDLGLYGFTEADLEREFYLGVWRTTSGFLSGSRPVVTLREIIGKLRQAYCGAVGYEYTHITGRDKSDWLRDRIETAEPVPYDKDRRLVVLESLIRSSRLETFLATEWPTTKRYGLDGGETLVAGIEALFDRAADLGIENMIIVTSHSVRLNVMANVLQKPMCQIFIERTVRLRPVQGDGDHTPIYTGTGELHLQQGASCDLPT